MVNYKRSTKPGQDQSQWWPDWRTALYFVQPRSVLEWQKRRFRDYWRALSQAGRAGRPKIAPELRQLIKRMWVANPTWGSPRDEFFADHRDRL